MHVTKPKRTVKQTNSTVSKETQKVSKSSSPLRLAHESIQWKHRLRGSLSLCNSSVLEGRGSWSILAQGPPKLLKSSDSPHFSQLPTFRLCGRSRWSLLKEKPATWWLRFVEGEKHTGRTRPHPKKPFGPTDQAASGPLGLSCYLSPRLWGILLSDHHPSMNCVSEAQLQFQLLFWLSPLDCCVPQVWILSQTSHIALAFLTCAREALSWGCVSNFS